MEWSLTYAGRRHWRKPHYHGRKGIVAEANSSNVASSRLLSLITDWASVAACDDVAVGAAISRIGIRLLPGTMGQNQLSVYEFRGPFCKIFFVEPPG